MKTKTLATFKSNLFNSTETKDYFINPNCFGDDVAKWLLQELRAKGIKTDKEPGQEDFGWFFDFTLPAQGKFTWFCSLYHLPSKFFTNDNSDNIDF